MSSIFNYKGTPLSDLFTTPAVGTATASYDITDYYIDTTTKIITGLSSSIVEKYDTTLEVGYKINGNDISKYACPTYDYWTQPAVTNGGLEISIPSWARYMTVMCIGGGGGGGAGSNGFKRNDEINQNKNSQNGAGGGGGSGAEYKIYRGLAIPTYTGAGGITNQITVEIGAGGQGGQGSTASGADGQSTTVTYKRIATSDAATATTMSMVARGGNGGDGGQEGQTPSQKAANAYNPWTGAQWRGTDFTLSSGVTRYADSGNSGSENDRSAGSGGGLNIYTDYISVTTRGAGGDGGSGSNFEDQGRGDGDDAQGGYVRIYWMADL